MESQLKILGCAYFVPWADFGNKFKTSKARNLEAKFQGFVYFGRATV